MTESNPGRGKNKYGILMRETTVKKSLGYRRAIVNHLYLKLLD